MSRQFDGTDDNIDFGSPIAQPWAAVALWLDPDSQPNATQDLLTQSDGNAVVPTGLQFSRVQIPGSNGHLQLVQDFTLTDGTWITPVNGVPQNAVRHVAVMPSGSSADDPEFYIDAVLITETEVVAPNGTPAGAAENLLAGEDSGGGNDYAGAMGFLCMDGTTQFTAADVNRHRWWGVAPGGPSTVEVWVPMWTEDLDNKGTSGNGDSYGASGTTMQSLPKVERMGAGLLGVGR